MSAGISGDSVEPMQVKDVVYRRLRDRIVDLSFAPGTSLREVALSELLGVSKTPIREAFVRLERDGLVEVAPYRGVKVRAYSAEAVRELFEARGLLETECVRRAAERRDPELLAALESNIAETERALDAGDAEAVARGLDVFDEILFASLGNSLLADVFERLTIHLRRIGNMVASPDRSRESVAFHRTILGAIAEGRAEDGARAMAEHIAVVRDAHASVVRDADGA
ncbi:GntR family transcriptional regulator [Nocardioides mangrovi]|uniref:GntR family transcriptional regulator n=1 Tax=Nocardioides mangrovi TaxID=2874580 RepID=A0ABS7UES8_9ACTN|nr:GntR family transcriptional regulator [Nocardioides mangrovi]MBZ5739504.1 GntR family transcriptional regulator [Nocardioides mangrovi]